MWTGKRTDRRDEHVIICKQAKKATKMKIHKPSITPHSHSVRWSAVRLPILEEPISCRIATAHVSNVAIHLELPQDSAVTFKEANSQRVFWQSYTCTAPCPTKLSAKTRKDKWQGDCCCPKLIGSAKV